MDIPKAIKLVCALVNNEIEADEAFTTNRSGWKNAKTKALVQRAVAQQITQKKSARTKHPPYATSRVRVWRR